MENDKIIHIQYRNWLHGQPPKRIKLDIPGWAGNNTWETPQPWHCKPFADANSYGLELIYTWKTTCTVTCDENGKCTFDGDFSEEKPDYLEKEWHPMASFAPFHFGYVSMVDIKTHPDHNLMVMPHPRYYADREGIVPCAIPGQLEMDWWPEIFFIVFKAPLPGKQLVFKHGDPIAQFMVVPRNIKYDIQPMNEQESELRAERQGKLENNWNRLCTCVFYCKDDPGCEKDNFFDNKYKVLSAIAKRDGNSKVGEIMDDPKLIPHYYQNPEVVDNRNEDKRIPKHDPWVDNQIEESNSLTNEDLEEMYDKELLNQFDSVFNKDEDSPITEQELDQLITAFKIQKRKKRIERSNKIKSQCDPKVVVMANQEEKWILGHRIEKLK